MDILFFDRVGPKRNPEIAPNFIVPLNHCRGGSRPVLSLNLMVILPFLSCNRFTRRPRAFAGSSTCCGWSYWLWSIDLADVVTAGAPSQPYQVFPGPHRRWIGCRIATDHIDPIWHQFLIQPLCHVRRQPNLHILADGHTTEAIICSNVCPCIKVVIIATAPKQVLRIMPIAE